MSMRDPDPRALARSSDAFTSHLAANDVPGNPRHSHRVRILAAIVEAGGTGLTWEQAGENAGVTNAWRRVSDLKNLGLIQPARTDTGDVVVRPMTSGRCGQVWVTAEAAVVDAGPARLF